nr:immunoglobulin heavy chain junction region [Macaca mulatta]
CASSPGDGTKDFEFW